MPCLACLTWVLACPCLSLPLLEGDTMPRAWAVAGRLRATPQISFPMSWFPVDGDVTCVKILPGSMCGATYPVSVCFCGGCDMLTRDFSVCFPNTMYMAVTVDDHGWFCAACTVNMPFSPHACMPHLPSPSPQDIAWPPLSPAVPWVTGEPAAMEVVEVLCVLLSLPRT